MGNSGEKWEDAQNPLKQREMSPFALLKRLFEEKGELIVSRDLSQLIGRERADVYTSPFSGADQIGTRNPSRADAGIRPILIPLPDGCLEKDRGADGLLEHLRPRRPAVRKDRPKGNG